jgi:hypothetical protein
VVIFVPLYHLSPATSRKCAKSFSTGITTCERGDKTLHKWEQGSSRPSGAARTLLRIAAADPATVKRVLAGHRKHQAVGIKMQAQIADKARFFRRVNR